MLSRVAESLWWLSRNLERAETLARVLDVNYTRTMDHLRADHAAGYWRSMLDVMGMRTDLGSLDPSGIASAALEHCAFSPENRISIVSSIRIARSNALHVRAELSSEMWEAVNGLYLFAESASPRTIARDGPSSFLRHGRDVAQALGGIIDATLLHDQVWDFLYMGRFFERAQLTTRIMTMQGASSEDTEVRAMLQMCCASEPFAKIPHALSETERAAAFLLLNLTFPRSVRYAIREIDAALHRISGTVSGSFSNEAERLVGMLHGILDFVQIGEIVREGIATFAGRIAERLDALSFAIEQVYFPRILVA